MTFVEQRLKRNITSCPGTQGVKGNSGVKWFKPINNAIPHFVCCEACYEDVALGTNLGHNFVPSSEEQSEDSTWSCDMAVPYLRHCLPGCAWTGDWQGFVQAACHRMSLPECVGGVSSPTTSKKWYNTVIPSPISHMTVCEGCYLDRAAWQSGMARNFAPVVFGVDELSSHCTCDFRSGPVAACSDILLAIGMYNRWHDHASLIMCKPTCKGDGISDGEWYGLPNPIEPNRNIENFDICAACHAGWNQSAGWGHLFRRLSYPSGTLRICDLNPAAPRYSEYFDKWNQMYFTRDPAPFLDYVFRLASLSKCQGTRPLHNAKWYGDQEAGFLICPSCFEETVRGTQYASAFPLQNTPLPTAEHCSLYSLRMRLKYAEACKERSLDSLLSFAREREQIYQEVVSQRDAFVASQEHEMEMLNIARQQREFAKGVASLSNVFSGGYPLITNYDISIMPSTIMYNHQRNQILYDPRRPVMEQLEARWKEVE